MKILQYGFSILFLVVLFHQVGILIKILLNRKKDDIFNIMVNGFVGTFAIFEIIALPFNIFNLNVSVLYYLEIVVFSLIILLSFILNWKKNIYTVKIKKNIKNIIIVPLFFIIIMQIFLSSYLYTSNADDSFYISWAQQAKQLEQYESTNPSLGQENSIFPKAYIFDSWEIFLGFIARLFDIHVATLAHTICPIILIAISYMCYYLLFRRINRKNATLMLMILSVLFLFSGVSQRFRGYTLLIRIWQGKTILTNIFIPYILYHMCNLQLNGRKIELLIITNIATMAFNPIAIWIFPLLYFFFTIVMLFKKKIKNVFKMIIVIIPNLVLLPIYLKIAVLGGGEGTIQAVEYISYIECLKDFIRNGKLFVILYLLSFVYIIFKGNKKSKRIFIIIPILAFATILNPFLLKIVQKYVTTPTVYWRLFWLIPLEITISYAASQIVLKIKNNILKIIVTIFILLCISIAGKFMYSFNGEFKSHSNVAKIPQYIINETNFILNNIKEKVLVIAPPEPLHSATMRQLSSNIILLDSRVAYREYMENKEEKTQLYNKIQDGLEIEEVYEAFNKYKVDFIIVDKSNKENLENLHDDVAKIVYEDEGYIIIRNEQSSHIIF